MLVLDEEQTRAALPWPELAIADMFGSDCVMPVRQAIRRASVYVDTRAGAISEAGDIVQPLKTGVLRESDIRAELAELVSGAHGGRSDETEITLFKSVGAALEDLAGAILAYETVTGRK